METSTESQSKYTALGFTFGLHALLFLLLVCIVFAKPSTIDESHQGCILEWVQEGSSEANPMFSTPGSSSSVVTDASEKEVVMPLHVSGKQDNHFISEDEQLLKALSGLKGKNGKAITGTGTKDGDKPYNTDEIRNGSILLNRILLQKPDRLTDALEEGVVVVEIRVNENGKVISAVPGQRGSTTLSTNLYSKARRAALELKFNRNEEGVKEQRGTYTFVFTLE